ncbi:MAG TPA: nitrile hydratase subunit beta [Alphaproteobacteria bacterium]
MNGVHDMGGMHGFGPVQPEPNEPAFHETWEGRVLAMQRAMGYLGLWNIDMSRASQEMLPPQVYLSVSYYHRWALGLEDRIVKHGLAGEDEIAAGRSLHPPKPVKRILTAADVGKVMKRAHFERPPAAPARFKPGDRVRTRNINPATHTRLPRYARDRVGVVEAMRGCHVYPDSLTTGHGEDPQWLYTVVFDGRELWGEGSDPSVKVSIEAFEPYLVAA